MFRDLIGIPFVDGGRDTKGLDCYGCIIEGFKRYKIKVPDHNMACSAVALAKYNPEEIGKIIWKERHKWQRLQELEIPCLIAMSLATPGFYNHVALYIGDDKILHTRMGANVCIEKLSSPRYNLRKKRYYKYVE